MQQYVAELLIMLIAPMLLLFPKYCKYLDQIYIVKFADFAANQLP